MPDLPEAVLFDLDGTLVDSEAHHRSTFRRAFAELGWPVDDATLALFTGRRADDVFARVPGPWSGLDALARYQRVVGSAPSPGAPPLFGGVADLLADLAQRMPLGLVTSADRAWVDTCLGPAGLVGHFGAIVTRDHVAVGKPDPQGYALACHLLGAAPARALAVEDAPAGVSAATGAGIGRVVAVTTTFGADALLAAGATDLLTNPAGLRELLRS